MLRQLQQESGIVYVTILMIIVVMMTITVGLISLNVSQVTFAESEVHRIKAELLAEGVIGYVLANQLSSTASNPMIFTETLDGVTYSVNANIVDNNAGPTGADPLTININY